MSPCAITIFNAGMVDVGCLETPLRIRAPCDGVIFFSVMRIVARMLSSLGQARRFRAGLDESA